MGASPDEPAHITYAWGTVTGQTISGEKLVTRTEGYAYAWDSVTNSTHGLVNGGAGYSVETRESVVVKSRKYSATAVQVPQKLLQYPSPRCYRYHQEKPVTQCSPIPEDNERLVAETSNMTRYPPLFYAIAGIQLRAATALDVSGPLALYGARVTAVALSALSVAFGVFLLARRFPVHVVALMTLLALPPMAWFVAASVNPNGLEIAAAFLLAAGVLALRVDHTSGSYSRSAVLAVPLGTLLLAWTRPLSWVWASLILGLLLVPAGQSDNQQQWRRLLPVRRLGPIAFAATIVSLGSAIAWFVYAFPLRSSDAGAPTLPAFWTGLNPFERIAVLLLRSGGIISELIGNFGWLDTPLPDLAMFTWLPIAGVAVVMWFLGRSHLMPRWPVLVVLGLGYLVALLSEYAGAWGWQGRYLLPVTAAACLFAIPGLTIALQRLPALWRLVTPMLVGLMTVHALSVLWFLFRNVYGVKPWTRRRLPSSPFPMETSSWAPLTSSGIVIALAVLALGCGLAAVWRLRPLRVAADERLPVSP